MAFLTLMNRILTSKSYFDIFTFVLLLFISLLLLIDKDISPSIERE